MNQTFRLLFITLFIAFMGISLHVNAQPDWQWGKRGGGSGSIASDPYPYYFERVLDMATDQNSNVYILAAHTPGAVPDVDGHAGIGIYDRVILASWDCNGIFRWKKTFGTAGNMYFKNLGVDTLGGVYVAGTSTSTDTLQYAYFDSDTTMGYSNKSFFLIKYDTSGVFKWLNTPQPDTVSAPAVTYTVPDVAPYGLSTAPGGNSYLFCLLSPGNYNGTGYIVTEYGFHLLEYDKDGLFIGGTPLDITVSSTSWGPTLNNLQLLQFIRDHKSGKLYFYGQFLSSSGYMKFGTIPIGNPEGHIKMRPIYLASFSPTGANIWVKQSTPTGLVDNNNGKPVLDELGNIYIGGSAATHSGNSFNGHVFLNSELPYLPVPFVISVDTNGNNRWVSTGAADEAASGIGLTYRNSRVWLGGYYREKLKWGSFNLHSLGSYYPTPNLFLASFNAVDGTILSMDSLLANESGNTASALAIDKNNNIYVGGMFTGQGYVAEDTFNSIDNTTDWFVAKFGYSNCNCDIPTPNYSYSPAGTNTLSFNYAGSTPYTSISWDLGDGSPAATTANPTHAYSMAGNYTVCVTVANACGSNTYCMLVNSSGTSSISNIPGFANINIYPNPATQMIHIDHATAGTTLDVLNVTGTNMIQVTLKGNKDMIDVSNLASGMYLLRFTDKNGKQGNTRFVKQ